MMPFGFSAGPVQIATCNFPPRSCDLFTLPPHAPCRLQRFLCRNFLFQPPLPPHAPCRLQRWITHDVIPSIPLPPHAPCRLQHNPAPRCPYCGSLCLHTLRADCNCRAERMQLSVMALPPHAPCRLQPDDAAIILSDTPLCLHTLRADCNHRPPCEICCAEPLPPHAPCRLQRPIRQRTASNRQDFDSTRSVQIATTTS